MIVRSYRDAWKRRRIVPAAVRRRLEAALGSPAPGGPPPVAVVRPGEALPLPGEVVLEDGTPLGGADRLPPDAPIGYHRLRLDDREVRLITPPASGCPLPARRAWGWSVQLYAARSAGSWGIGDLADLRALAEWAATAGAGLLMVNPLNAPAPVTPVQPSPYFPGTRRFLNPLYLRVEEVPGAQRLGGEQLGRLAAAGRELNRASSIDRDAAFTLKMQALDALWRAGAPREGLDAFRAERGHALRDWARWAVIAEHHGPAWSRWPEELRRPDAPGVPRFAAAHADRVAFHEWVQWLLDEELARAGRALPLVQDVPIGIDREGADAWAWQDLMALDVNIGAPPDLFSRAGQDWGLPPFIPHRLRTTGHEPIIQTLRATLRHAGGLRIDHVMGLFRLWWIPLGNDPRDGAYVRYPADELLAVLAVESARAGAFVVGEDLGTVGRGVRQALQRHRILSYRLVYFERRPPSSYPPACLAAVTTHDLPTLAGAWTAADLEAQRRAGLEPDAEGLARLRARLAAVAGLPEDANLDEVVLRVHAALAASPALLVTATLEDALRISERPNLPGTTDQHPNWAIPLPMPIEELVRDPFVARLAGALTRRAGASARRR
ncbi:MAG TPA: 4-alpha-glucanotransferase [candidate division Zixibacteria bacterium]|nr:4-alpha-glucanotransferase [candidate division Zixibacteria bacterium]